MQGCFTETEDYIVGSKGKVELVAHQITGENSRQFRDQKVQMHQAEQYEFFKAIRGERLRINNGADMCNSTMMAVLGREVCYTGKMLTYHEVANGRQDMRPAAYRWGDRPDVLVPQPETYRYPKA